MKGKILLRSAFGNEVMAELKEIPLAMQTSSYPLNLVEVPVLSAITSELREEVLLSEKDFENLQRIARNEDAESGGEEVEKGQAVSEGINMQTSVADSSQEVTITESDTGEREAEVQEVDDEAKIEDLSLEDLFEEPVEVRTQSDADKLWEEQRNDSSLERLRKDADVTKNNCYWRKGFLYHKERVGGIMTEQLVLPKERRDQVLELSHNSVYGAHLGFRKTCERIRYSFYWPGVAKDVREFCDKCLDCQLRRRVTKNDRTPITPVTRPQYPFQVVNVDLIGPIDPPSAKGHKYVLVLVDQHSRWPEAVCLTSLTANSTCDALMEIFMRTGIPTIIACDQGTNFTAALTQELVRRLGASPRFLTPGYPQSNGLVERFNQVLKNMLHHVIRDKPRQWHKSIPFLLFAYREVSNATTGFSPFQLLYGRKARGPLAVLKSSWTEEDVIPVGLPKSAVNYMQDLKIQMELAAEKAKVIAGDRQKDYARYFNRNARNKSFEPGDQVIVLAPDSSNKLYARWQGPAVVLSKVKNNSYEVELPEGNMRVLHASHLRQLKEGSCNIVGVVFGEDMDFGKIIEIPQKGSNREPRILMENICGELDKEKRVELLEVLQKYPKFFSGRTGRCEIGRHEIQIKQGEELKTKHRYKVPRAMEEAVDKQIRELIADGFIEESYSEFSHPMVCVVKKDGSLRLCCDFRMINSHTVVQAFPMAHIPDLISKVGEASYISTIDLLRGYYQIPMAPECKALTAFATHRGQYQWRVMPFGLSGAAATFQKAMNKILDRHQEYAVAYLDDVAVFSGSWEKHLKHLQIVLKALEEAGLTANVKKCKFAQRKVKYLGHVVGSGEVAPDPENLMAIRKIQAPKTKKDVRGILGLCGYYREYIPKYTELTWRLCDLTKKKAPEKVQWEPQHQKDLDTLKDKLCSAPVLMTPKFDRKFIMYTDASNLAVGVCLAQVNDDGQEKPVAYGSQKLSNTQTRWATVHKEAYAVTYGLKKFESWIYGLPIEIVSDHNPLTYLCNNANQNSKLQRWALALQDFQLTFRYMPGSRLTHADALSRLGYEEQKSVDSSGQGSTDF